MTRAFRSHPRYLEGFSDAVEGWPMLPGAGCPYLAGWFGFYRMKRALGSAERQVSQNGV